MHLECVPPLPLLGNLSKDVPSNSLISLSLWGFFFWLFSVQPWHLFYVFTLLLRMSAIVITICGHLCILRSHSVNIRV